jgi:glycosyltransferase involved in cell wall biosynthesis
VQGVRSYYLGFDDPQEAAGGFRELYRAWRTFVRFRRLLRELRPDIVHAGYLKTAGLLGATSGFHPLLLMPFGSDVLIFPWQSRFNRMVARYVIRKADAICCDAAVVRQQIVKIAHYPNEKILVFPWGVDLKVFRPHPGERERLRCQLGLQGSQVVLMNRAFKPIYGIEYFLQALPGVISTLPQVRVLLIGEGPLNSALRNLVSEQRLDDVVRFVGAVRNEEMASYLNAADLYVSSSLSDGTSISLLEAMGCGLPAVVTDVPGNLEWVQPGMSGLVVPRRDSRKLAEAIVQVLSDRDLARRMAETGAEVVAQRADWDRSVGSLERLYGELCSQFSAGGRGAAALSR